jgi:hypothetical protein
VYVRGVNLFIGIYVASRVESNWQDADRIGSRMNDGTRAPVGETIESSQLIFIPSDSGGGQLEERASASLSSHLLPAPKLWRPRCAAILIHGQCGSAVALARSHLTQNEVY